MKKKWMKIDVPKISAPRLCEMWNKQRDLLIAIPVAIFFFGGFGFFLTAYLDIGMGGRAVGIATEEELGRISQALEKFVPKKRLPIPRTFPVKRDGVVDFDLSSAAAGVIIDVDSGQVIFEKNASKRRPIASTTKLLTAMVVVDRVQQVDEYITIPEQALDVEGTRIGCKSSYFCEGERLVSGEEVKIKDLLRAILVSSANDAATALAMHVAGTEEGFALLMNLRMKELRLNDSVFCRPSGLEWDDEERDAACYSSAKDIGHVAAVIAADPKYALLQEILTEKEGVFFGRDGTRYEIESTNELLGTSAWIIGGKTGFTPRAGRSLVMIGKQPEGEKRLVTVVLDDNDRFTTTQNMMVWAVKSHEWR